MSSREAFLTRVRHAVAEGNRAGQVAEHPRRNGVGYQGAGAAPLERFITEMKAAGGHPHTVPSAAESWEIVRPLLRDKDVRRVLLGRGPLLDRLGLVDLLRREGYDVKVVTDLTAASARDGFFQADVGISGVEYLIAETGSLVMATKPPEPRSLSLLPPLHIALGESSQILPDLFDLFDLFAPSGTPGRPPSPPPSCLTLITGPSKTGDIELRLVTGVHGPGELHVVVSEG